MTPCPECGKPMEGPLAGELDQSHPPPLPADVWFCPEGGCRVETVVRRRKEASRGEDL